MNTKLKEILISLVDVLSQKITEKDQVKQLRELKARLQKPDMIIPNNSKGLAEVYDFISFMLNELYFKRDNAKAKTLLDAIPTAESESQFSTLRSQLIPAQDQENLIQALHILLIATQHLNLDLTKTLLIQMFQTTRPVSSQKPPKLER